MTGAFFDFDGTLYTGHVWQDLAGHLWATKRHRRWILAYVARNMAPLPLYKLGLLSQVDFYRAWGETMGWLLRGWPVDEAHTLFEQLTEVQIMPNLRASMVSLLRQHQDQGHVVALVSGTFAPWLETVARRMEVSHSIGTPLEVCDGRYTGRIIPPLCQGPGKAHRVIAYLSEEGLEVNWATSFAYGDSGTDLPLLSKIGHPTAAYPDETLLAHAQAQGWPVVGEAGQGLPGAGQGLAGQSNEKSP
jgi:HAD superfamily hydrolase (TIGR01490 family)